MEFINKTTGIIAAQILKAVNESELSRNEICRRAKIKYEQLQSVLRGNKNYSIDTLTKISEVLEIEDLKLK